MEPWEMGVEDSEDEELFSSDEEFADEELEAECSEDDEYMATRCE